MYIKPIPMGSRFGRLVVVDTAEWFVSGDHRVPRYVCNCDCGGVRITRQDVLRKGNANSCGCLHIKHGNSVGGRVSGAYGSWAAMKARCLSESCKAFRFYGAKGIKICDRWMDFANFLEDMGEKPNGWAIDRIDPKGNYEPGNCRWLSISENSRRAVTKVVTEGVAADIKTRFLTGQKQSAIARSVGHSRALVSAVCLGKNLAYVRPSAEFYDTYRLVKP